MREFTIDQNENGYHIHGLAFHWNGYLITPLYRTCHSYEECIEWLDKEYPDNYRIVTIKG